MVGSEQDLAPRRLALDKRKGLKLQTRKLDFRLTNYCNIDPQHRLTPVINNVENPIVYLKG